MKLMAAFLVFLLLAACSGPGGPATRAGRAVDRAVYHVGHGIARAGEKIEGAATGN